MHLYMDFDVPFHARLTVILEPTWIYTRLFQATPWIETAKLDLRLHACVYPAQFPLTYPQVDAHLHTHALTRSLD